MNTLANALYLALSFLALFGIAEILYHRCHWAVEYTRKLVHAGSGLLCLSFPLLLNNHWLVLALCSSFLLILKISKSMGWLLSVNAVERQTHGSTLFPFIVYICYLGFTLQGSYLIFYLPITILAISDPMAALVGKNWPWGKYNFKGHSKTLAGSLAFLMSAFLLTLVGMVVLEEITLTQAVWPALILALLTTFTEALLHKGFDNLMIPLVAMLFIISI